MHQRSGWWCPQPPPLMPLCASFPFHVLRKPRLALGCRLVSQGRASTGSISVPFGSYEPRSLHRSRARMSHWAAARGSVRAVLPAQQLPSHHSLESPNPSRPIQARVTITLIARDSLGPQCNERKLLVVGSGSFSAAKRTVDQASVPDSLCQGCCADATHARKIQFSTVYREPRQ